MAYMDREKNMRNQSGAVGSCLAGRHTEAASGWKLK